MGQPAHHREQVARETVRGPISKAGRSGLARSDASTGPGNRSGTPVVRPAACCGFVSRWQPPGQPFVDTDAYVHVYNPEGTPAQNPGSTGEDGEKKVVWRFGDQQVGNLQQPGGTAAPVVGRVVVLAIPCLSENVPADLGTAAMATYAVSRASSLMPVSDPDLLVNRALNKERLSRVACQVPA